MKLSIGENIKRLRRERDMTQEQLACALNVTCASVSKWERGENCPDISLMVSIAYYFGVTLDSLVGYDGEATKRKIDEICERYAKLYHSDYIAARELIVSAYAEYPDDYRIMSLWMWNAAGDRADNDPSVLLAHREEFRRICDRILEGSDDERLRLGAWNMRAKLLHAEGKTDEAIEIYNTNFGDMYNTALQVTEQLFAKGTPEFLYWVRRGEYELAAFAADKFTKEMFFDNSREYSERIARIEAVADGIAELRKKTGAMFLAVIEQSIRGRLANDLTYRGGEVDDIIRARRKQLESYREIKSLDDYDKLTDREKSRYACDEWPVDYLRNAPHPTLVKLRENEKFKHFIESLDCT